MHLFPTVSARISSSSRPPFHFATGKPEGAHFFGKRRGVFFPFAEPSLQSSRAPCRARSGWPSFHSPSRRAAAGPSGACGLWALPLPVSPKGRRQDEPGSAPGSWSDTGPPERALRLPGSEGGRRVPAPPGGGRPPSSAGALKVGGEAPRTPPPSSLAGLALCPAGLPVPFPWPWAWSYIHATRTSVWGSARFWGFPSPNYVYCACITVPGVTRALARKSVDFCVVFHAALTTKMVPGASWRGRGLCLQTIGGTGKSIHGVHFLLVTRYIGGTV